MVKMLGKRIEKSRRGFVSECPVQGTWAHGWWGCMLFAGVGARSGPAAGCSRPRFWSTRSSHRTPEAGALQYLPRTRLHPLWEIIWRPAFLRKEQETTSRTGSTETVSDNGSYSPCMSSGRSYFTGSQTQEIRFRRPRTVSDSIFLN